MFKFIIQFFHNLMQLYSKFLYFLIQMKLNKSNYFCSDTNNITKIITTHKHYYKIIKKRLEFMYIRNF